MTGDKTDVDKFLGELREEAEKLKSLRFYDGIISTVMELNSNPAHFVWELLQNAEDAEATYITFILGQEALMVVHNGRDFTKEDVKSICNIGDSSKKAKDSNKIGKFGIGFKSVFNYTSTPSIHSGEFSFAIHEYFSPHPLNAQRKGETLIVLPFDNPKKSKEKAFEEISIKLQTISSASLLFLKNIQEIKVNIESGSEEIKEFCITREVLSSRSIPDNPNLVFEEIKMKDWQTERNYYRFTLNGIALQDKYDNGEAEIAENQSVMIAYPLSPSGDIRPISQTDDVKTFFVSFPTEVETHLEFLVHAPFKTVVSRETIKADSTANETLYDKIAELVGKSLPCLVQENKVTRKFYNDILLNTEESVLHERIRGCLAGIINEQYKVLPTFSGEYASLDELLLFSESYLNTDDINNLKTMFPVLEIAQNISDYSSKKFWDDKYIGTKLPAFLHTCATYVEARDEIEFNKLAKALTSEWLESKTVDTINNLYTYLPKYWEKVPAPKDSFYPYSRIRVEDDIVQTTPLIRTIENKHILANTKGLYLEHIHQDIIKNETSRSILTKYFKIKKYDEKESLKVELLSKYSSPGVSVSLDENVKDLRTLLDAMRRRVIYYEDISNYYLISGRDTKTNYVQWNRSYSVFQTQKTGGTNEYAEVLLAGVPYLSFLDEGYVEYVNSGRISWEDFVTLKVKNTLSARSFEAAYHDLYTYAGGREVEYFDAEDICGLAKSYSELLYVSHDRSCNQKGYWKNEYDQIKETPEGKQLGDVTLSITPLNGFRVDKFIPYLDRILESILEVSGEYRLKKSLSLYRLLSESGNILRGKISWKRDRGKYDELETIIYSEIGNKLRSKYWMYDKNRRLCAPYELDIDTVADGYRRISESLLEKLGISGAQPVNLQITGDDGEQKTVQISQKVYERTVQDIQEVEDNWNEILMADDPTGEDNPTGEDRPTIGFALTQENRAEHIFDEEEYDASYISPVTNAEKSSESIRSELYERMQQYSPGNDDRRGGIADYGSYPTNTASEIGLATPPIRIVSYDRNQLFICEPGKSNDKERRFLESQYKGVCQICGIRIKKGEPNSKDDFPYYYIARNVIRTKHLDEEIRMTEDVDAWNSLSLCPNCAAKYLFAEKDMSSFKEQVEDYEIEEGVSRFYDINIILEGRKERIRYKPKHFLALKTAFAYFAEKESEKESEE